MRLGKTFANVLALTCVLATSADAALTWDNAGPTNNWSTAAGNGNWLPGNVVWTNGEDAIFGATAETVTTTTTNIVDDISFGASWTIANGGALSIDLTTDGNSDITVDPTFSSSIAEVISGTNAVTKLGTGTLVLTNTNTYTGATNVNAGTLQVSANGRIPTGSAVTVNTNGTLLYANTTAANNPTFASVGLNGGTLSFTSNGGNDYSVWTGVVNVASASVINMSATAAASGANLFFDSGLTGSANLTLNASIAGAGLVLRTSGSTYSGTMTINGSATPGVSTEGGLSVGALSGVNFANLPNANLIVNGTLEMGNQNIPTNTGIAWANGTPSGLTFQMNALSGNGLVIANMQTAASTRTLSVGNNNGTGIDFSGVIANGVNNTLSFIKNGNGTQTLSGLNTYSGTTTINGGTLLANTAVAGTNSATGTGTVSVGVSGTLGGTGQIRPTGTNAITVNGTLAPGAGIGTLTINSAGSTAASILTMISGSTFVFELGAAGLLITSVGTSDRLAITSSSTGDVTFNNNSIDFLLTGAVGYYKLFDTNLDGTTWNGLTFDGTSGIVSSGLLATNLASGLSGTLIVGTVSNGGDVGDIYLQVVPEPSSLSMLFFGGVVMWLLGRKRT